MKCNFCIHEAHGEKMCCEPTLSGGWNHDYVCHCMGTPDVNFQKRPEEPPKTDWMEDEYEQARRVRRK